MLMFLEARHLFLRFYLCRASRKKGFSPILSNMKAYVFVRGSVANISDMSDKKGPEIILFQRS